MPSTQLDSLHKISLVLISVLQGSNYHHFMVNNTDSEIVLVTQDYTACDSYHLMLILPDSKTRSDGLVPLYSLGIYIPLSPFLHTIFKNYDVCQLIEEGRVIIILKYLYLITGMSEFFPHFLYATPYYISLPQTEWIFPFSE